MKNLNQVSSQPQDSLPSFMIRLFFLSYPFVYHGWVIIWGIIIL